MKVMPCGKGHFYDGDKYDSCPYCNGFWELGGSKAKLEPEIMEDPPEIVEDSAFLYCENGHYFDIWKYDRCPICGTAELWKREKQEEKKEQPRIDIVRCDKGHFYNGAVYDTCPYCSKEVLKKNGLSDKKQQSEQKGNQSDKDESSGKKKIIVDITYCDKGHYYDGKIYDTCPYCSKREDESSSDGSFENFGRADNRGMYHVEFWDVTKDGEYNRVYGYTPVPPEVSGRAALKVQKCGNGHYFDGNRNKVCPYCGEAAAETIETI